MLKDDGVFGRIDFFERWSGPFGIGGQVLGSLTFTRSKIQAAKSTTIDRIDVFFYHYQSQRAEYGPLRLRRQRPRARPQTGSCSPPRPLALQKSRKSVTKTGKLQTPIPDMSATDFIRLVFGVPGPFPGFAAFLLLSILNRQIQILKTQIQAACLIC